MDLFTPYTLNTLTLRNRMVMAPMCTYTADEKGNAKYWHYTHYTSRAAGGCGLILVEATAVTPNGRISAADLGIWNEKHIEGLQKLVRGCHYNQSKIGIQLAHAGRKCTSEDPVIVAPSALAFDENSRTPKELTVPEIEEIIEQFGQASARAREAGFDVIEIHGAHGYLIHQFLSPLTNQRTDSYGETLENRTRFLKQILQRVREEWPQERAIFLRVSAEDYAKGGLDPEQMIQIINQVKSYLDMVHVSSGGLVNVPIEVYPGYQIPMCEKIKQACQIPTIAVGLLNTLEQGEEILGNERADLVAYGRKLLRDPYFALQSAVESGHSDHIPEQYKRAYHTS